MKKRALTIYSRLMMACLLMLATVAAHAQEVVSTYDIKTEKASFWSSGAGPSLLFGALFVVGIYLIYHYWANGTIKDDM